ncbi:HTH domain-containing protein [Streptomyces sp. NPDC001984]
MSRTTSPDIAARRAKVRQIRQEDPQLSASDIGRRLGVSKDTVLRDLRALEQSAPDSAPHDADRLVLVLDEPLRQALAVLRAKVGSPDTQAANERAARAAIRVVADTILEEQQHSSKGVPTP